MVSLTGLAVPNATLLRDAIRLYGMIMRMWVVLLPTPNIYAPWLGRRVLTVVPSRPLRVVAVVMVAMQLLLNVTPKSRLLTRTTA